MDPPVWVLAAEVLATILALFLLGSFKYQIHKNALTFGMSARHYCHVFQARYVRMACGDPERPDGGIGLNMNLLSFHGLDDLIHADTMLFILA